MNNVFFERNVFSFLKSTIHVRILLSWCLKIKIVLVFFSSIESSNEIIIYMDTNTSTKGQ